MSLIISLYLVFKIQGILENYRQRNKRKILVDVNTGGSLSPKETL